MKTLLIMPEFATYTRFYRKAKFHFPFSIWYLGTQMKSEGHDVELLDYNIRSHNDFTNYDYIGISAITSQIPRVKQIARRTRETSKRSHIAIGGVHPTLYPTQTKESGLFDDVCTGHAIKDFANMPMLDYSLLDKDMMSRKDKNYVGLVTSIGCPYKCTFCVNSIVPDYNKWQAWSAERICDEIERAQSYGFKNIFFWDDNFFISNERTESFIRLVYKNHLSFNWFALVRANKVSRKLFRECKKIGLQRVSIGGESGSDEVHRRIRKQTTVKQIEESARILNEIGIEASYSYMIGLPNETKEDILLTQEHLKRMGKIQDLPKVVGPMLYCPYPGSKLYEECKQFGWQQPQRFEDWNNETTGNVDSPYELPWVEYKDMTQVYWFYSFLIPVEFRKIAHIYITYLRRTNRNKVWWGLLLPILLLSTIGKLRHYFKFYRFPIETFLLKKWKVIVGA